MSKIFSILTPIVASAMFVLLLWGFHQPAPLKGEAFSLSTLQTASQVQEKKPFTPKASTPGQSSEKPSQVVNYSNISLKTWGDFSES